jgi:hypothetical protein
MCACQMGVIAYMLQPRFCTPFFFSFLLGGGGFVDFSHKKSLAIFWKFYFYFLKQNFYQIFVKPLPSPLLAENSPALSVNQILINN